MPKISVVIPTLNEEKYLKNCLESFKKQSFTDFEIIISDGGSTDNTVKIAKKYGAKVIITSHPTITYARQKGIEHSQGEIIVCADADTYYQANHLQLIASGYKIDDSIVAVGGGATFPKDPWWVYYGWKTLYMFNRLLAAIYITGYIPAFNLSFRKETFQKIGGYNTYLDFGGDEYDIIGRLKKVGKVYYDTRLEPLSSNRRAKKVGFVQFYIREGLIDYYLSYFLAKIFKKTIIHGTPVR